MVLQTGYSRKQIYYDLKKINQWLDENQLPPIVTQRSHGLYIEQAVKERAIKLLSSMKHVDYTLSQEDKVSFILVSLFIKPDYLSMHHFIHSLMLSKSTVTSALKEAGEAVRTNNVEIGYNRQEGYHFKGHEYDIRNVVMQVITKMVQHQNGYDLLKKIYEGNSPRRSFDSSYAQVHRILRQVEEQLDITFVEENMKEQMIFLTFLFLRIEKGNTIHISSDIKHALGQSPFSYTAQKLLKNAGLETAADECVYLTLLLQGINIKEDSRQYQEPNQTLINQLINEIIHEFERMTCLRIPYSSWIRDALYTHLKPAFYRIKYQIPMTNPFVDEIKKEHPDLFHIVKKSLRSLEKQVNQKASDDEIAYVALHFGAFIETQGFTIHRKKGVIICPNGVGTSNMLKYQIENLVPQCDIVQVLSVKEFHHTNLTSIDIVFSTLLINTDKPLIVVNPILTVTDKLRIIQEVDWYMYAASPRQIDSRRIIEAIRPFVSIQDEGGLSQALSKLCLEPLVQMKGRYRPVLNELLTKNRIQIMQRVDSWESAIREAANPLLDSRIIEDSYIDAMIDTVKEIGPYIVIAPRVAIPHARPEKGVNQLGMAMLKLEEPISFSSDQDDKLVNLVIVLAAVDSETHLKALSQLSELLEDEENIEKMIASTTVEEMYHLISAYS
ncbi:BglG family transcription antiterminator [Terrilactibacillus laevilacticus]|uniref:Ascorbate-specific PTS system EIIA component n=1 Tax=Terrilactibacillus laevilacticus TaxID=1380157 RepID=A0ABW5PMT0_9BACI